MLVSLKWLRDYVELALSPQELADRLTMAGLEVEGIEERSPAFRGVKVARILSLKPHPNSDHLSLCEVTTGDKTVPVVCGAKNMKAGDWVALATVGAELPGGLTIRSAKLRGEASEGMLCSEEELGIGSDHTGIMILPEGLPLGADLEGALGLGDTVLDIGITPNRSDCLSMIGMAREVAAITGKTLRLPPCDVQEAAEEVATMTAVEILDPDLCPRYTARVLKGVKIGPSPLWMRQRLEAVGLRPINNIVDATNFVMLEWGQPLHAFDFCFLEQGRIVVRKSREGEPFVSLDGKERKLKADTLMICDGAKPVAIAGVMGGLNSEVKEETETILLESAYFHPASIRRTSRELAMPTDAAFRFERGIDPEGLIRASNRAARLMAETSGGVVLKGVIDAHPRQVAVTAQIPLRIDRVGAILGSEVPEGEMVRILESLAMTVTPAGPGAFAVTPPTCRVDITREIDLVEEIVRLYGYDRVPTTLPSVAVESSGADAKRLCEGRLRGLLTGAGYTEVINYSFFSPEAADQLGLEPTDERRTAVRMRNPLTEEQSVLRTTMVHSLLANARRNADYGRFSVKLFEVGKTFISQGEGKQPRELNRLACLITGLRYEERWHWPETPADFYDLKGVVENLLESLRIPNCAYRATTVPEPFLHPGKSCGVFSGEDRIGFLGEIHPALKERLGLTGPVVVCELDLDGLAARYQAKVPFRTIPRFPSSSRDAAFLVAREVEAQTMVRLAQEPIEELLEKVQIFDVYERKNLPAGTKSVGLRFAYRSAERTLTDEEVSEVHGRVVQRIVSQTGASIR
jgi:phenylalanyl-tRNA synthetase beta chain